jgi:1,4-dihydroxy-2-naphthoyl-CoA synthase
MSYATLAYDLRPDGVATLRLNRPEAKNAMNGTMYDEARGLVAEIDRDPAVRVVVLTGTAAPSAPAATSSTSRARPSGRKRIAWPKPASWRSGWASWTGSASR